MCFITYTIIPTLDNGVREVQGLSHGWQDLNTSLFKAGLLGNFYNKN